MSRVVVNVATDSWVSGQVRLWQYLSALGEQSMTWANQLPAGCPPHRVQGTYGARHMGKPSDACVPYAFKAYALKAAADAGHTSLLWLDASVIPQHPLDRIWQEIETKGYFIPLNGWDNSDWTADSAYPDLFPEFFQSNAGGLEFARGVNRGIRHAVGTAFGLDLKMANAAVFLHEYYRLGSTTRAFCGPWQNELVAKVPHRNDDRPSGVCGPVTTLGHRHDQTAISVLAWRLKMELSADRTLFSYKGPDSGDAVLCAVGV